MELAENRLENGIKLIKLSGRLDVTGTEQIDVQFTSHAAAERAAVLVDLSDVELISSMGIRMLLSGAKGLSGKRGRMGIVGPQRLVAQSLDLAGIGATIPIYSDLDEAIEGF